MLNQAHSDSSGRPQLLLRSVELVAFQLKPALGCSFHSAGWERQLPVKTSDSCLSPAGKHGGGGIMLHRKALPGVGTLDWNINPGWRNGVSLTNTSLEPREKGSPSWSHRNLTRLDAGKNKSGQKHFLVTLMELGCVCQENWEIIL